MKNKKSHKLWERAQNVFPGGVNSPVRAFRSVGGEPVFIAQGAGTYVTDADGHEYVDFLSSWGPLILGHAPRKVVKAIRSAAKRGSTFGATTRAEVDLGEFILDRLPFAERLRFVNSGTEAVMTALRLARGITGRQIIIKFEGCYHGHNDALLAKAGSGLLTATGNIAEASSPGVPEDIVRNTLVLPLDDSAAFDAALKKYADQIACVIIEPVPANAGLLLQRRAFIEYLLTSARAHKVLVIFDEVISGFRLGFTGYTGRENLIPDIITYGKIIGGGLPVGAIAGSAEIMDALAPKGPVYQAGTLSGNPLAMAAGLAALSELARHDGAAYSYLRDLATHLRRAFAAEIEPLFAARDWRIQLVQDESLFWLSFRKAANSETVRTVTAIEGFSAKVYAQIFHAMLDAGIYLAPSAYEVGFLNTAMKKKHIEYFVSTLKKIVQKLPEKISGFN
ncbi:MAG: glutamate-1-semialdehyde 2,1-aminomutase [Leptospiraceae bacterium]|nr:glutamate-1-semialdehyde 2,1-aminomutase [Leptospiraceae bacterium]